MRGPCLWREIFIWRGSLGAQAEQSMRIYGATRIAGRAGALIHIQRSNRPALCDYRL